MNCTIWVGPDFSHSDCSGESLQFAPCILATSAASSDAARSPQKRSMWLSPFHSVRPRVGDTKDTQSIGSAIIRSRVALSIRATSDDCNRGVAGTGSAGGFAVVVGVAPGLPQAAKQIRNARI